MSLEGEMAAKSSIPESIKQFVPTTCCQVRNDHGTYRVYKYGSKKKPDGTWTRDTGYLIGKIVEQIGKESSKSGAQNQGLVSNLQAPDFVLSL